jgi:hypothetical protein
MALSDDRGLERSLAGAFADTVNDGREWLAAEIRLIRAQINEGFGDLQSSLISALVATACATAGALVLALALVDFAAPYVGEGWAGVIVGGALLIVTLVLFMRARSLVKRASLIPDRLEKHLLPKTRPADD